MCRFDTMRWPVFAAVVAFTIVAVTASDGMSSWVDPRPCVGGSADYTPGRPTDTWVNPVVHDCDRMCAERCYAFTVNATVLHAPPVQYCNTPGAPCEVMVFIRTAPCNACIDGSSFSQQTTRINDVETIQIGALSQCDVAEYIVLVGPDRMPAFDLYTTCRAPNTPPQLSLTAAQSSDAQHGARYSVFSLDICYVSTSPGAQSVFVFDKYAGNPHWPAPLFWNRHFRDELLTPTSAQLESVLRLYQPLGGGNNIWLEYPYTRPLQSIDCDEYEARLDSVYSVN